MSERVGRINAIRPYNTEEQILKIKDNLQAVQDKITLDAFLEKYLNPDHLSFSELLEHAVNDKSRKAEALDFILELGT